MDKPQDYKFTGAFNVTGDFSHILVTSLNVLTSVDCGFISRCFPYFPFESYVAIPGSEDMRQDIRTLKVYAKNTDKEIACTTKNTLTGGHVGDH